MKHIFKHICLLALLFLGSASAAWAITVDDIIFSPASPEHGSLSDKSIGTLTDGVYRVTFKATPDDGYLITTSDIVVQPLTNPAGTRPQPAGAPGLAQQLDVHPVDGQADQYYFDLPERYDGAMVTATFSAAVTPSYYVLHKNGTGYVKVNGVDVTLSNDKDLQFTNLYDKGHAFWYLTREGYLQNNVYYLNVANNQTLYLSVEPVSRWQLEDFTGAQYDKKHIKCNGLYLIYDGGVKLSATPADNYYNACPVTITETGWSGPTNGDLTIQSPQLVTYLRYYFTQKMNYEFYDDSNTKKSASNQSRYVYATLSYDTGGANKETDWDIDAKGIIYNKKASGAVTVTATYNMLPAEKKALELHPQAVQKNIKLTINQKVAITASDNNYLLYSIKGNDNYRYPYDDGVSEDSPVKPNGKGGNNAETLLTDPDIDDGNKLISWKITRLDNDLYTFQNVNTNRYLYFNDTPTSDSDYGTLCMGATTLPSGDKADKYKFRFYQPANDADYGKCICIIPYNKMFAIYKNDGIAANLNVALNNSSYTATNVVSLSLAANSTWCIYPYKAEWRVRSDFNISTAPTSTSETGQVTFKSDQGWYGKYITESPKTGNAQRALVINGTYNTDRVDYIWTVIDLDDYINHDGWTSRDGGFGQTNTNNQTFKFSVTSLPSTLVSGVVQLQLSGVDGASENKKWSGKKTVPFTIMGKGELTYTPISTLDELAGIADTPGGAYRLTADITGPLDATITSFSGMLDGNGHKITDLKKPLFGTLTNGTVHDLTLDNVSISQTGQVGAVACVANGGSRIYNVGITSGSVGSTGTNTGNNSTDCCGGLVGLLDGSSRVVNCFSYADITSGNRVGGIVGYNNYTSTSNDIRTMVMNCMFYGDITGGTDKAPIYNGKIITNRSDQNGMSNFNYFSAEATYVKNRIINTYNCALMAEKRYLQRFEFFRHLLNSNRELAAWWITGKADDKDQMMKWVLEPSQIGTATPYPILKPAKDESRNTIQYPSVVNIDAKNATVQSERNKGGKLGELKVTVQMGSQGSAPYGAPTGAGLKEGATVLTLNITDKDPDHFNFNYYKVQLPYYNDVGTGNYTGNRVVTGWKIIDITTDGTVSEYNKYTTGEDATANVDGNITSTPYNFADRYCYEKDLFSKSGRIFNQGAYWDVPEGVTAITIAPYWAKAAYASDEYYDRVYNSSMGGASYVTKTGGGQHYKNDTDYSINGQNQKVYTSIGNAKAKLGIQSDHTVYDNAVVLVGNVHATSLSSTSSSEPYTIMSADFDNDNEPDYSYILRFDNRAQVHPVRVDFINIPGLGMAQKSNGGTGTYNFGIMMPWGWFESTNTSLFRVTQFEYDYNKDNKTRAAEPYILQGGVIEQWVNGQNNGAANQTTYFHLGGNVWFKEFHRGTHIDNTLTSKHPPLSVTGGDYDEFYLTGLYKAVVKTDDNAECYINGGRFGTMAGTGMEGIGDATNHTNGNIIWQIQHADITEFYGGGINAESTAEGNITTVITGSHVNQFCGGPKFGDMNSGKTIVTTAKDCQFGTFFGAGYGGNSYSCFPPTNKNNINGDYGESNWNKFVTDNYKQEYKDNSSPRYKGVSTKFRYEYLPMSNNTQNVARIFIDFVTFSLATTHDVTNKLTGCTITGNYYGGGSLGKVDGPVTSTLKDCTVKGNVFGGGFSATLPKVEVMNTGGFVTTPFYDGNLGVYLEPVFPATVTYTWQQRTDGKTVNSTDLAIDKTNHILYTNVNLSNDNLGSVSGAVNLSIDGNSTIGTPGDATTGNVYGGGDQSTVNNTTTPTDASITVSITGNTQILGDVFGGGNQGLVSGNTTVNIQE